jgi:hypothetical protein
MHVRIRVAQRSVSTQGNAAYHARPSQRTARRVGVGVAHSRKIGKCSVVQLVRWIASLQPGEPLLYLLV